MCGRIVYNKASDLEGISNGTFKLAVKTSRDLPPTPPDRTQKKPIPYLVEKGKVGIPALYRSMCLLGTTGEMIDVFFYNIFRSISGYQRQCGFGALVPRWMISHGYCVMFPLDMKNAFGLPDIYVAGYLASLIEEYPS